MGNSPHTTSIHILDDDSLLNIFYLYRPYFLCEEMEGNDRLHGGKQQWVGGRWWYRLAHVCQRWRILILGSASYLHLSLVCSNGTPVANMLAHSPPLPLTVDYSGKGGIAAGDEEGLMLVLEQHRNRVRHLRLCFPVRNLQKFVMAIDGEFPILEYLIVGPPMVGSTPLMLRETLQAPHLKHLMLTGFTHPIGPRLHPTAVGLVTLDLLIHQPSAYFQPNILLQWISFMPQLEKLVISFVFPGHNRDAEMQFTRTPITTPITLPNLRWFWFYGISEYLEAIVCRISTPRLEKLQIQFFEQLTFSVPRLVQFMNTTGNLRFDSAELEFSDNRGRVETYLRETNAYAFAIKVYCWHLDWQVSSVAQILSELGKVFSLVEHLSLELKVHEEHNEVDRIEWHILLRSFSNVKTLHVEDGLVEKLARCLRLESEDRPLELLPELQVLTYSGSRDAGNAFTPFINSRQNAGRPVTLVHPHQSEATSSLVSSFGAPVISSLSGKAGYGIEGSTF